MTSMFVDSGTKKLGGITNKNQKINATASKRGVTTNNSKWTANIYLITKIIYLF